MRHATACESCGNLVLKTAEKCQACGQRPGERTKRVSVLAMLVAFGLLALIVGVAGWMIPPINEAIGEVVRQVFARLASG
jgi:hypothetical protein